MKDYFGREITVNDRLVYVDHSRTSSKLIHGKVTEITPKSVVLTCVYAKPWGGSSKTYERVVRIFNTNKCVVVNQVSVEEGVF